MKPQPAAHPGDEDFGGSSRWSGLWTRPNAPLLVFFASLATLLLFWVWATVIDEEAMRTGRSGPPMPEGILQMAFAFGQFFLIGLPIASILTAINLFASRSTEPDRIKTRFSVIFCSAAWLLLAWSILRPR